VILKQAAEPNACNTLARPNPGKESTMPKATGDIIPITTLHNLPLGEIVDQLGRVKAEAAEIKAREDLLKAELTTRGVSEAESDLFRATVTVASRWTLDAEHVKAEMGVGWYDSRCKIGSVTTVRVSARTGDRKAA
jgi:hypothetical protein